MKSYKNPDHLLSKKERFLIVFDLDGTALEADYETFNKLNKRVLKYLSNKGHIVCIATGKNYLSALPYYKELDLNTYLVTYNGALISNPFFGNEKVKNFAPISNDITKTILSDPKIKNELRECLVDTVDNETISTSENVYWKEVFFNNNPYVAGDILSHLGNRDCLQVVLEFPNDKLALNGIISTLRKYRASTSFNFLNKLKKDKEGDLVHDPNSVVIRIRSVSADKGNAVRWLSSYYGIPLSETIAIGDDKNDFGMISVAHYGIVMANGTQDLKAISHTITKNENHLGGLGDFLVEFFNIDLNELESLE